MEGKKGAGTWFEAVLSPRAEHEGGVFAAGSVSEALDATGCRYAFGSREEADAAALFLNRLCESLREASDAREAEEAFIVRQAPGEAGERCTGRETRYEAVFRSTLCSLDPETFDCWAKVEEIRKRAGAVFSWETEAEAVREARFLNEAGRLTANAVFREDRKRYGFAPSFEVVEVPRKAAGKGDRR